MINFLKRKKDKRPDWDEYFLILAKHASVRATCQRAKHGCVLTRHNTVVSIGYNGAPPGVPHCIDDGCIIIGGHCERCNHAEVNAICQAAKEGHFTIGATAYITGEPCLECLRTLICAGIVRIVYAKGGHYPFPKDEEDLRQLFIRESGIEIVGIKL